MRLRLRGERSVHLAAKAISLVARAIGHTLRTKWANGQEILENLDQGKGQILCTWHGCTMVPVFLLRGRGIVALTSPSRDGEFISRYVEDTGGSVIRGSSGRYAARCALACVRAVQKGATLALAPDGPKGPNGSVQPGVLYFAMKSGAPIYPAGVAAAPAWRLPTWDRHMLPKPFARAAIVFGAPIHVSADAGDEEISRLTELLGVRIDELQREAEAALGIRQTSLDRV